MAGSLRQIARCWLKVGRPVTDANAARSLSVTTTMLADKKPTQAPKPAVPPKPAASSTASTKGDMYQVPEFYAYNMMSYYEMESDMRKSRLPQPKPGQPNN